MFDLPGEGQVGLNPPLVEDDPTLVTENFGLGVGFKPPGPTSATPTQHPGDIEVLFIPVLNDPIAYSLQEMKPSSD